MVKLNIGLSNSSNLAPSLEVTYNVNLEPFLRRKNLLNFLFRLNFLMKFCLKKK